MDSSDCSSDTDEYDSDDSDSLDFGSVSYEDKTGEQDVEEPAHEADAEWSDDKYPPLPINEEALKHIASQFLPGNHGKCVEITSLPRGSNHEIRLLHFEDGWTCIGRFARDIHEALAVLESEVATAEYVRMHSTIPVPETYFVNPNPNHVVGAAFTITEKIEGQPLYKIWDELTLDHKKSVMSQISDIVIQMAEMKFAGIGSLKADGTLGALKDIPRAQHAFYGTKEYLLADAPNPSACTEKMNQLNAEFQKLIISAFEDKSRLLSPPYPIFHADFDAQNMLVVQNEPTQPPQIVGIIDWDHTRTGLLYELMEYPIFIQDVN